MILALQIMLLLACIFIVIQFIAILAYKREYNENLSEYLGLQRALKISKNKLIDSERERQWLNNQIDILLLDIEEGRAYLHHPKYKEIQEQPPGGENEPR